MFLKILSSYKTSLFLLFFLALGAAIATFIENDFGSLKARYYVYNALWYEALLVLCALNMMLILFKYKIHLHVNRFTFHAAFVLILIGSGLTRYLGEEGVMKIRENATSETFFSAAKNIFSRPTAFR